MQADKQPAHQHAGANWYRIITVEIKKKCTYIENRQEQSEYLNPCRIVQPSLGGDPLADFGGAAFIFIAKQTICGDPLALLHLRRQLPDGFLLLPDNLRVVEWRIQ